MELETKVTQYEEEIKEKKTGKEKSKETLPRGPPRHVLKGNNIKRLCEYLHDISIDYVSLIEFFNHAPNYNLLLYYYK